jgi:hypothetical protein
MAVDHDAPGVGPVWVKGEAADLDDDRGYDWQVEY